MYMYMYMYMYIIVSCQVTCCTTDATFVMKLF